MVMVSRLWFLAFRAAGPYIERTVLSNVCSLQKKKKKKQLKLCLQSPVVRTDKGMVNELWPSMRIPFIWILEICLANCQRAVNLIDKNEEYVFKGFQEFKDYRHGVGYLPVVGTIMM